MARLFRFVRVSIAFLAAVGLGLFVVLVSDASVTWLILIVVAMAVGVAVVWSQDAIRALLYVFVFTAPLAITKSLVPHGDIYPPYLELTIADVPFGVLVVMWAIDSVMRKTRMWPSPPWGSLLLAILVWVLVSAVVADNRLAGTVGTVNQTRFLLQFAVLYSLVKTPRILRGVLAAAGAGLALNLLMVAAQMTLQSPLALQGAKASAGAQIYSAVEGMETFRPSGFLLHPNPFAAYLVMLLPVPIVLVFLGRHRVAGRIWWSSLVLASGGTLALLLTLSRGGWISFMAATAFALIAAVRRGLVPTRRVVATAGLVSAVLATALVVYPTIVYRLTRGDKGSTETRWMLMEQAAMLIRANPILGVGLGRYTDAIVQYTPPSFALLSPEHRQLIHGWVVHNGYLLIWAEKGLVGLLLQVAIILAAVNRLRATRDWWDPVLHGVAIGLVAGLVGQSVLYLFDQFYQDLRPGVLWAILGLVAAVFRLQEAEAHERGAVEASAVMASAPVLTPIVVS